MIWAVHCRRGSPASGFSTSIYEVSDVDVCSALRASAGILYCIVKGVMTLDSYRGRGRDGYTMQFIPPFQKFNSSHFGVELLTRREFDSTESIRILSKSRLDEQ